MFQNLFLLNFIEKFQNCFKIRISKTLDKLILEIFIVKDIKNKQEIIKYLQNIILYAQLTSIKEI